ncbi:Ig-like, group 2 [Beggiatoa sp. PS]|nr:Ig-like, group 2 [Beggiatoa sp. PS]
MQTTVFPYSDADVSANDNTLYAIWVTDEPNRNAVNRTQVVFSNWNGTEWSELQAIANDGTADFHPQVLALSDDSALAIWEDTNQALSETAQFEDMVKNLEISVSNYDPQTQQWTTQRLTDNAYLDRSPKLAGQKTEAIVTWISNETNDIIGSATNPNQLWFVQWVNNAWTAPQVIAEMPYPLIKYNIVYDGQTGYVILSLDTDSDFTTIADRELFQITFNNGVWGNLTQLTTDTSADDNPQLGIDPNGQFILTWLKGGELSSIVNFDMATKVILKTDENGYSSNLADFKLATSAEGKLAMLWAEPSEESGSDIQAVFYDTATNAWGNSKQLTFDQETEQRIAASFYGTDELVMLYNRSQIGETQVTETTETGEDVTIDVPSLLDTDLYMLTYSVRAIDFTNVDYPQINPVLSLNNQGPVGNSQAQFYGGISLNDSAFELTNESVVRLNDTITVGGIIVPEQTHVEQQADILVVGLHTPDSNNSNCDPQEGSYYMNTGSENNYCSWIVQGINAGEYCNPNATRRQTVDSYWQSWSGNLTELVPLYTVTLTDQIKLTAEEGQMLYRDKPDYTGYVCLNFGYRLHDPSCQADETNCCQQPDKNCPLIFNGDTINFSVQE